MSIDAPSQLQAIRPRRIGVVGGMGPYAGLAAVRKIFDHTQALNDQDHLDVMMISAPATIQDRTAFLMGEGSINPAFGIVDCIERLVAGGAEICAAACHTAHSPQIMDVVYGEIARKKINVDFIHMLDLLGPALKGEKRVGLMATLGSWESRLFHDTFEPWGVEIVDGGAENRARVHEAIYHPEWGIKACSEPISQRARDVLIDALEVFAERGVSVVLLGCTELPLALPETTLCGLTLLNSLDILAKELVRRAKFVHEDATNLGNV